MDKLNTRGADQNTLKVPMVTTNAGMRTFTFTGAKEWKRIKANASSIASFKRMYF